MTGGAESRADAPVLAEDLRSLGLGRGDLVLVHSNIGGADLPAVTAFYRAVLKAVGPGGTAAYPNFSWKFCEGVPYDCRKSPSAMGLLTELARRDPEASRLYHPLYGFSLLGSLAGDLSRVPMTTCFGEDSFFGELRRRAGKILLLNIAFERSMTFMHHVEELSGCAYRFMKDFAGTVVGLDGKAAQRTVRMYVRDRDRGVVTDLTLGGRRMEDLGLVRSGSVGPWPAKLMEAGKIFEAAKDLPRTEPDLFRRIAPRT